MEDQQFCLKWSNHHSNMVDIFGRLLTNEALCDVTLACDGYSFKAHKLVLSASSSFFQTLFLENPCTHPIVILPELKYMDMKALVDFMYNGQVNVSESQLPKLLKAAENLRIKGLSDCRLKNSTISDKSKETLDSSFAKMDCTKITEQPKRQFEKDSDSSSCNVDFHVNQELFRPDLSTENRGSAISNQLSSDGQSSGIGTLGPDLQASQQGTDGSDITSISDTEIEMEPSKMMEQSMTTDYVFKSHSLDLDQQVHCKEHIQNEIGGSINSDDACANLPDTSDNSQKTSTTICLDQGPCSSKDDKINIENISGDNRNFPNASSCVKDDFVISKEKSICIAGPSTIVFETSVSQSQYSPEICSVAFEM